VPHGFAIPALPAVGGLREPLLARIYDGYGRLAERCGAKEPPVAVRSSALDEDGALASFAGQHDTYLNIRGSEGVVAAVERCVRSAASPEAMAYRKQHGLPADDVRIAVLVQQLVHADVSAVVFSANPISGSRDEVMITASWGLGESIVGGTVTPDTFVVDKQRGEITMLDIALKRRMTVVSADGTREIDVPDELKDARTLDDEQVLAMTELAMKLEQTMGHAVDIECAMASDALFLLQCRPITTLG
jgi:pyruvate,water dikinase